MNNQILEDFFGDKVVAAFSKKSDGNMKLTGHPAVDDEIINNRGKFLGSVLPLAPKDYNNFEIISSSLLHGGVVEVVEKDKYEYGEKFVRLNADGLITVKKNLALTMANADCPTVFFYDPRGGVIGIAHVGWRGILAGIIENMVGKMQSEFNSDPTYIEAYVGPGIRQCHYEVGREVAIQFPGYYEEKLVQVPKNPLVEDRGNNDTHDIVKKYYLNLQAAIMDRLLKAGVISMGFSNACTFCSSGITEIKPLPEKSVFEYQYFSARRQKVDPIQAQMGVIMLK